MAYQLSPGVLVTERDLTTTVPAVATSSGGFAGKFKWGPINDPILISTEQELASTFGSPDDDTAVSFFTAANFLGYSNTLLNVRARAAADLNAVGNTSSANTGSVTSVTIINAGGGYTLANTTVSFPAPALPGGVRAQGTLTLLANGAPSAIIITNGGSGYTGNGMITLVSTDAGVSGANIANISANITITGTTAQGVIIENEDDYTQNYSSGIAGKGEFAAKYAGTLGNSIKVSICDANTWATWTYSGEFDGAPSTSSYASQYGGSNDELHVIVLDADGAITGTTNQVLERFAFVSKASDAVKADGTKNYYKELINRTSNYLWWIAHPTNTTSNWGTVAKNTTFGNLTTSTAITRTLSGGANGVPTDGNVQTAYELFVNDELYDVSLLPTGALGASQAKNIVNNVAEIRKDCVVFISPELSDVQVGQPDATKTTNVTDFRTTGLTNLSSSYAVLDSGWKYQYDRYNDVYRWIPLNGDIAGLCARTDFVADPWFSPGGLNRGQIRNIVKLAFNPNKTQRDALYKAGVNPVISSPGTGTVLFGDKTLLSRPSAFDRINVRRLFIVLEKAIAAAAKSQLFEFNDEFTRAQFNSIVEPFLRDVKGRRGITDYKVVCDTTNNTGEVIDRNEFVADIYVKPARSINYITLNFIATRTGISFEEITG